MQIPETLSGRCDLAIKSPVSLMNAVLHLPVAEQYPSRTATVESLASKRISGISGSFLGAASFCVQRNQRIAPGPARLCNFSGAQFGKRPCCNTGRLGDLRLSHSAIFDFGDDLVPIHL